MVTVVTGHVPDGDPAKQLHGVRSGQLGNGPPADADQPAELVPRGDHRRAARGARQQRAELTLTGGVVEHDQDAAAGQHAAVQGGPLVVIRRNLLPVHVECPQEPAQHRVRPHRLGLAAAQVRVELAVREGVADLVAHGDRQRRLTDPARSDQRHDRARAARPA
jgi:hypothetical protein